VQQQGPALFPALLAAFTPTKGHQPKGHVGVTTRIRHLPNCHAMTARWYKTLKTCCQATRKNTRASAG
jgi:hypothetical protein